jgi:NAD(P)H-flavin reductase
LESPEGMDGLDYRTGRLPFDLIWRLLPRPTASTYYLSGPPEMLKSFSAKLAASGIFAKKIRNDDWE